MSNDKDPPDRELRDVMQQERRRGRKPLVDPESERRAAERRQEIRRLLEHGTEAELVSKLISAGLTPDSPEFAEVVAIWRAERFS